MHIGELFVSYCVPGKVVPWARAGRQGHRSFTPRRVADYKSLVQREAEMAMLQRAPIEGPVLVDIKFFMEVPQSYPAWKQQACLEGFHFPTAKPDLDNLIKGVKDAMNGIVYKDDSQVVRMDPQKLYGAPGLLVEVYPVVQVNSRKEWQRLLAFGP